MTAIGRIWIGLAKRSVPWLAWPGLLATSLSVTAYGLSVGSPLTCFSVAYALQATALLALERWMPHEAAWNESDGQTGANIGHTLVSKGTAQSFAAFGSLIGAQAYLMPEPAAQAALWPTSWPLPLQVLLGLAVAEFGLYWAHRLAHELPLLWRFHAIHHSVTRLWVINTGRFHFIDSLMKAGGAILMLWLMGVPLAVTIWISAVTAYIGLLTHCNVAMRCGPLSLVFNTPELHRWHHSRDPREGNMNYGENLVLWDQIFGTFLFRPGIRPPANIGIDEWTPPGFVQQLAWPFRRRRPPSGRLEQNR